MISSVSIPVPPSTDTVPRSAAAAILIISAALPSFTSLKSLSITSVTTLFAALASIFSKVPIAALSATSKLIAPSPDFTIKVSLPPPASNAEGKSDVYIILSADEEPPILTVISESVSINEPLNLIVTALSSPIVPVDVFVSNSIACITELTISSVISIYVFAAGSDSVKVIVIALPSPPSTTPILIQSSVPWS